MITDTGARNDDLLVRKLMDGSKSLLFNRNEITLLSSMASAWGANNFEADRRRGARSRGALLFPSLTGELRWKGRWKGGKMKAAGKSVGSLRLLSSNIMAYVLHVLTGEDDRKLPIAAIEGLCTDM